MDPDTLNCGGSGPHPIGGVEGERGVPIMRCTLKGEASQKLQHRHSSTATP